MSEGVAQRRVLVVGRDYFFYTQEIISEMRRTFGAHITFVPITPPRLVWRILELLGSGIAIRWLERYHHSFIRRFSKERFDVVLFIQVHQIGHLVRIYREALSGARFVLYYWDSLRTHDYLPYVGYFDQVFSFDPQDVGKHPELRYLPLFYATRFRELRAPGRRSWDLAFVGVASSMRRYEQLAAFEDWARHSGLRFNKYLVVSPIFFLRMLLRGRRLRSVHFRWLAPEQVVDIYRSAVAIVDLPNNSQSGFTMRTFEALGAHRKLITTNEAILKEDFHTRESIYVIGGSHGDFPDLSFLESEPVFSPALEGYCIRKWVSALMGWALPGEGR
ncbi:MAG: hypothetical protein ABIQ86_05405 [Steroidobacteraceae bacterium]